MHSKFLAFLVLTNNMEVLIMQWSEKSSLNCVVLTNFMFHLMLGFVWVFGHEMKAYLGKYICVCMYVCVCKSLLWKLILFWYIWDTVEHSYEECK